MFIAYNIEIQLVYEWLMILGKCKLPVGKSSAYLFCSASKKLAIEKQRVALKPLVFDYEQIFTYTDIHARKI